MKYAPITALFFVLGMGCAETPFQGTSTGNAIRMGLEPTESGRYVSSSENGTEFTIDTAEATVTRLSFPLPSLIGCDRLGLSEPLGCDASGEGAEIVGNYSVDLLAAEFSPDLDDLTLPAIKFESMTAEVDTVDISGVFDYDNTSTMFTFSVSPSSSLAFNAEGLPKIQDNETLSLLLNPQTWLQTVPVVACIDDGDLEIVDGRVALTNACGDALDRIDAAMAESTNLTVE